MEYAHLGRSGLRVSRLCLGTMNFGPQTNEADSFKIMDRAHEHGINFFDTANVYGWKMGEGITEQIVGNWFAQGGGRREKTIIATKLFGRMGEWPNESRISALHIRRACEESLRRMKTDHIDLYQMHHIDREVTWDEVWQAMEVLVQQGKILYAGSSNFAAWNIVQGNETARARRSLGLVSEQSLYNLLSRSVELEVLPACQAYGVGFIPWSPLSGGLLAGGASTAKEGRRASDNAKGSLHKHRAKVEAFEKFAAGVDIPPASIAMAWLLGRPGVTAPIIGPRSLTQLDEMAGVLAVKLTPEMLQKLDEICPGPGNQAPEAYAW
jgi:aryl-alcohol dehydrogenase-like predicted oxidoreductase